MKYCDQLTNLNASNEDKRPILSNRKGVIFLTTTHTAKRVVADFKRVESLHHPPYSSDLVLLDVILFLSLKNSFRWYIQSETIPQHSTNKNMKLLRDWHLQAYRTMGES